MLIVRYQLKNDGTIPEEIIDGGYFPDGDNLIGIASSVPIGGEEVTLTNLYDWVVFAPADHLTSFEEKQKQIFELLERHGINYSQEINLSSTPADSVKEYRNRLGN